MSILRRSRSATNQEIAVASAILYGSGDARSKALLDQFRQTGRVRRIVSGSFLTVSLLSTPEDLLVDLDRDIVSRPVELTDKMSGGTLSFFVTLKRGGFFGSLHGHSPGRWPKHWDVDYREARERAAGALALKLTGSVEPDVFASLLAVPINVLDEVVLRPPAYEAELVEVERREGRALPTEARTVLGVSDGLIAGELTVLGCRDTYVIDLGDGARWWLVGQDRDGRHYLCSTDGVAALPEPEVDPTALKPVASSYSGWLRNELLKREH